jgi:hypothetical protein
MEVILECSKIVPRLLWELKYIFLTVQSSLDRDRCYRVLSIFSIDATPFMTTIKMISAQFVRCYIHVLCHQLVCASIVSNVYFGRFRFVLDWLIN